MKEPKYLPILLTFVMMAVVPVSEASGPQHGNRTVEELAIVIERARTFKEKDDAVSELENIAKVSPERIRPAIPVLLKELDKLNLDVYTEAEGEYKLAILRILVKTGDQSLIRVFLKQREHGLMLGTGLARIGLPALDPLLVELRQNPQDPLLSYALGKMALLHVAPNGDNELANRMIHEALPLLESLRKRNYPAVKDTNQIWIHWSIAAILSTLEPLGYTNENLRVDVKNEALKLLASGTSWEKARVAEILGFIGDERDIPLLEKAFQQDASFHGTPLIREDVEEAIAKIRQRTGRIKQC